jgi:hypothetical protein
VTPHSVRDVRAEPLELVSCDRIVRLRAVMPEESPIDLDVHAAMIAYEVERQGSYREALERRGAGIQVTRGYVDDVRRFLDAVRQAIRT